MVKKIVGWLFLIGLALFVTGHPSEAAVAVKNIGGIIMDAGSGFGAFLAQLAPRR